MRKAGSHSCRFRRLYDRPDLRRHHHVRRRGQPIRAPASPSRRRRRRRTFRPMTWSRAGPRTSARCRQRKSGPMAPAERLCRKPQPHLHALPRRAPQHQAPRIQILADMGAEHPFPVAVCPWRDATVSSLPRRRHRSGSQGRHASVKGKLGVDAQWENCIVVVMPNGQHRRALTQWDNILKASHFVASIPTIDNLSTSSTIIRTH